MAAADGNIPEIKRLLGSGVAINCRSSGSGMSPLTWAIWDRRPEAVRFLLKAGADPNLPNATGKTPLFLAMGADEDGTNAILTDLIIAGANVDTNYFMRLAQFGPNRIAFESAMAAKRTNSP